MALNLKKLLDKDNIALNLESTTKEGIIGEMVEMLKKAGKIKSAEPVLKAILERERKMSTGMEHGIAIPHGKTEAVDRLVVALGISREGVDFASLDGQPAHIFVMTASPLNRTGPHIQFLAEVGRLLTDARIREKVLAAHSAGRVVAALTGGN